MDSGTYAVEALAEETHWWFVGRRRLFSRLLARLQLQRNAPVLDVGTSTGTNLRMLRDLGFSAVVGLDPSPVAIRYCNEKGLGVVEQGDAGHLPFPNSRFELVLATDVIEHIDDDGAALREIARVLVSGGYVLITVPAFEMLWGLQDEVAQHRRRYRMASLESRVQQAGLRPVECFHFNFLLFVPIWVARQIIRFFRIRLKSENEVNSPLINRILSGVMSLDISLAPYLRPPFGVSALILARKI